MPKHDAPHKPKKFRLNIVGAIEDQPRMIRAYGRACMGEFGLVLRPREGRGVLVLVTKEGATMWEAEVGRDSPLAPTAAIDAKAAVRRVREEQTSLPSPGPTTLRGQWSGYLHCDEGKPRVELKRPLASYGTLWIVSHQEAGWSWRFERGHKWFSEPTGVEGAGQPTLARAIEAGVLRAMKLVSEACSFRDTHRRAAHDPAYAAEHPIRPPKEGKDPTERLKEPKRVHQAKKAARSGAAEQAAPSARAEASAPATAPSATVPMQPARPPGAPPQAVATTAAPAMPKRERKRRAVAAEATAPAAASPEADPAKDKALLDAFTAAIAQAMAGGMA